MQYGPSQAFPRAAELPGGPPSEDSILVTCAYLVDPSSPWVLQSLFLAAIGEARDRGASSLEAFSYRYSEGESSYERFRVHRTVFPQDFLADFGFEVVRFVGPDRPLSARARWLAAGRGRSPREGAERRAQRVRRTGAGSGAAALGRARLAEAGTRLARAGGRQHRDAAQPRSGRRLRPPRSSSSTAALRLSTCSVQGCRAQRQADARARHLRGRPPERQPRGPSSQSRVDRRSRIERHQAKRGGRCAVAC